MNSVIGFRKQTLGEWFLILLLLAAFRCFRQPRMARWSNLAVALGLFAGVTVVVIRAELSSHAVLLSALSIGAVLGVVASLTVSMVVIPSLIALQNGAGGLAAAAVAFVELASTPGLVLPVAQVAALITLGVGAVTAGGSLVAFGRLGGALRTRPVYLRRHNAILAGILVLGLVAGSVALFIPLRLLTVAATVLAATGAALGILSTIRVGGADMPVVISALNAMSGVAAALAGIVVNSNLLIACGAAVASSGLVLTAAMCRAMNRNLRVVLTGHGKDTAQIADSPSVHGGAVSGSPDTHSPADRLRHAASKLRDSRSVIVVPGYGMALAKAQFAVADLVRCLDGSGRDVVFAIHPVAGRMPGHMYVLLAEAGMDYGRMLDIESAKDRFQAADVALVVGACDVVNPVAAEKTDTPISGMPILPAHEAKAVLVCNLDAEPGYSGVPNPLYTMDKTLLLPGDAKVTVEGLVRELNEEERR